MTIGRTIDRILTSVSEVVYACIIIAIIFTAIFVLPFLKGAVYVGALIVLGAGIVFAIGALIYEGWKRHHP
jgi:hypothetical protein